MTKLLSAYWFSSLRKKHDFIFLYITISRAWPTQTAFISTKQTNKWQNESGRILNIKTSRKKSLYVVYHCYIGKYSMSLQDQYAFRSMSNKWCRWSDIYILIIIQRRTKKKNLPILIRNATCQKTTWWHVAYFITYVSPSSY